MGEIFGDHNDRPTLWDPDERPLPRRAHRTWRDGASARARSTGRYGPLAAARPPRWDGRSPLKVEEPLRGCSRASPAAGGTRAPAATRARSSAVARARRAAPAPAHPRSEAWRTRASPWCAHAPIMLRLRRSRGREERRVDGQPAGEKNRRLVDTFLEGRTRQPPGGGGGGGRADANGRRGGELLRTRPERVPVCRAAPSGSVNRHRACRPPRPPHLPPAFSRSIMEHPEPLHGDRMMTTRCVVSLWRHPSSGEG